MSETNRARRRHALPGAGARPHRVRTIAGISGVCPRLHIRAVLGDTPSLPATAPIIGVWGLDPNYTALIMAQRRSKSTVNNTVNTPSTRTINASDKRPIVQLE